MGDALISIKPIYVEQLLAGGKLVEIRRRRPNMMRGTRLWIYSTRPVGRVEAVARVDSIEADTPGRIWARVSEVAGITRRSFQSYLSGCDSACILLLSAIQRLVDGPDIGFLRKTMPGFHPPQFFKHLDETSPLLRLLMEKLPPQT